MQREARDLRFSRRSNVFSTLWLTYAREKRLAEATALLRDATETGRRKRSASHPQVLVMMVTLAEPMAPNGRNDEALLALKTAVDNGYRDGEQIRTDDDLKSIRNDPRYIALVESLTVIA